MTRYQDEPHYSLITDNGRHDIKWALKYHGLRFWLVGDIISDTWYSIRFRFRRRK